MKRREFLKAPALGLLVPGSLGWEGTGVFAEQAGTQVNSRVEEAKIQQRMHPDFVTFVPGIEYFYLGNGDIQGAIQYSPVDSQSTLLGLTLMDPEHFCRKWSTFLYHPEKGMANTKLGVSFGDGGGPDNKSGMYFGVKGYSVTPENLLSVKWKYPEGVPVVSLRWMAGDCEVEEEIFVPAEGALLFRRVRVKNGTGADVSVQLSLSLYANFGLFDTIFTDENTRVAHASGLATMRLLSTDRNVTVAGRYDVRIDLGSVKAGESGVATYVYAINGGERLLKQKKFEKLWKETVHYWAARNSCHTGNELVDRLFDVSRTGLRAVVARSGKMDAGPWMYNMEWLGDHMLAIEALLRSGFVHEANVMFEKNLKHSIGPDGRTIESGRWFGYDYTEINQNGILLYGVWSYLCWTGDTASIKKHWGKIKLCAEFPLLEVFLDKTTHMVRNKREFWERSDSYGIENGYELAYQVWIALGLEKAAAVARVIGDAASAKKWSAVANDMKKAMLGDPKFQLIEDGHFIKRRTADGRWQRYIVPPNRSKMPPGSPIATEERPSAEPDTVTVLPIVFEMIDPGGALSIKTLAWVEQLWNQAWTTGGYPRYNVTSEDNPPAPWPIASMLVARAYAAAGDDDKVWRILKWLGEIHGGTSGGWFERYAQSITPPMPPVNVVGWIWYEIIALCVHHIAGFRPELDRLVVRPRLLKGLDEIMTRQTVRGSTVELLIRRARGGSRAVVNGREAQLVDGSLSLRYPKPGTMTRIEMEI